MTTEHVSVPREFSLEEVLPQPRYIESSGRWEWPLPKHAQFDGCCKSVVTASREWWEYTPSEARPHPMAEATQLRDGKWYWVIPLSRATPSDASGLCGNTIVCNNIDELNIVELFPSAPRVVTDGSVADAHNAYNDYLETHPCEDFNAMRAALESFAASLPAARVPDGWKLVPVEPTEEMLEQACTHDTTPRNADKDQWNRDTWSFMLAAAPQAGEKEPGQ